MFSLLKNKYYHILFLSLLSLYYIFPLVIFQEVVINPHDLLEIETVYFHVISEIYKGNFNYIDNLLAGNIKWYYLEKLFFPINIFNVFLGDKVFFFFEEIVKKILTYFSFFILAKSLKVSKFDSALGAILYTSIINISSPIGLGVSLMPYVLYLLVSKKILNIKHYIAIIFIGLNTSFAQDIFSLILIFFLSFYLTNKKRSFYYNIILLLTIVAPVILANSHIIFGAIFSDIPIHREDFLIRDNFITSFLTSIRHFFAAPNFHDLSSLFLAPLSFLYFTIILSAPFNKEKQNKILIIFFIFVLLFLSIFSSNFIEYFFIGPLEVLKGLNFRRIDRFLPLLISLILIYNIAKIKKFYIQKIFYSLTFISILSIQLMNPFTEVLRAYLGPENIISLKKNISNSNYNAIKSTFFDKDIDTNTKDFKIISNRTFNKYYQFENYKFIKNIVKDSRVMSVGLDPMVAIMNDIKTIDGYHTIYPKDYKIKFRKIISRNLEADRDLKKYYDDWGNRVYAFYNTKQNLMLNFQAAKEVGAEYVISAFSINSEYLKIICGACNKSKRLFLYKIL